MIQIRSRTNAVRDADASADWYFDLLGMQVALSGDDESVKFRVLAHPGSGCIDFSPSRRRRSGWVVVFRDPDNVQLEFWLPAG